ncbi:MAG: hypothetical protein R3Y43_00430 [Alphaproteobacteria bacterium]
MRFFLSILFFCFALPFNANAQSSSQKDASYLAILKAVVNNKIADEDYVKDLDKLRENQRFNEKLSKALSELDNSKNKNYKNKKVVEILLQAGKDIDSALGVN